MAPRLNLGRIREPVRFSGPEVGLPEKCRRLGFGEFHFSGNAVFRQQQLNVEHSLCGCGPISL
jgi:hypothetical protein